MSPSRLGLLLGASSPDDAPLSIANVSAVLSGADAQTGALNVDAATGAFTYQLFDGLLTSDPITVTINVTLGFTKLRR